MVYSIIEEGHSVDPMDDLEASAEVERKRCTNGHGPDDGEARRINIDFKQLHERSGRLRAICGLGRLRRPTTQTRVLLRKFNLDLTLA